jgi:hypothetical protein
VVGWLMRLFAANYAAPNNGWDVTLFKRLAHHFGIIDPEQGAQTTIYLATSPNVEDVTGKYFVESKAVLSSQVSYDTMVASQLWQVSVALTGL